MTPRKALAEIAVDPQRGWVLPSFSGQPFRYQAWAHFEKDRTWGRATWTLLVELTHAPDPNSKKVEATVSFVALGAPHSVLEEGATFELFMGQVHYTHGRVLKIL
jgi:hypothetical protein